MERADLKLFVRIPEIQTDRLTLRRFTVGDYLDVFDYSRRPEVTEFLLWNAHTSEIQTKMHLKNIESKYRKAEYYDWAIEFCGRVIGSVGFTSFSLYNNVGEIGYVLNSDYWGLGIATEAARAVVEFGFERLMLSRIECRYIKENFASRRVAEKCGMQYEGCLRSSIVAKGLRRDLCISSVLNPDYWIFKKHSL